MRYAEAILICDNIAADSIGGREIDMDTNLMIWTRSAQNVHTSLIWKIF